MGYRRHPSELCLVDRIFSFERHNRCPSTQQSAGYDHVHPRHCSITLALDPSFSVPCLCAIAHIIPTAIRSLGHPSSYRSFGSSVSQHLSFSLYALDPSVCGLSNHHAPLPSLYAAPLDFLVPFGLAFFIPLHLGSVNSLYFLELLGLCLCYCVCVITLYGPRQIDCFTRRQWTMQINRINTMHVCVTSGKAHPEGADVGRGDAQTDTSWHYESTWPSRPCG